MLKLLVLLFQAKANFLVGLPLSIENCIKENPVGYCQECKSDYMVSSSKTACIDVNFIKPRLLSTCNADCATCSGTTSSDCLTCSDPNAEVLTAPGSCSCKPKYYASLFSTKLSCVACPSSCSGICYLEFYCISCSGMKNGNTSTCVCNPGYYLNYDWSNLSLNCSLCDPSCSTCTAGASNNCLKCANSSITLTYAGSCSCPNGTYPSKLSPLTCSTCFIDCSTCTGPSSNGCLTCSSINATVSSGTCVCKSGYLVISTNPLVCHPIPCYSTCLTCNGTGSNDCLSCTDKNAFTLSPGPCTCNSGFYNVSGICNACASTCLTCNGSLSTNCTKCKDPNAFLSNGSCICNTGFYSNGTSCLACHASCLNCSGHLSNQCLSCKYSNFVLSNHQCVCPSHFFLNSSQCLPCNSSCLTCSKTGNNCTSCSDVNSYLSGGICQCNTGFYSNNTICLACDSSCLKCSGPLQNECTSCKSVDLSLINGECICNKSSCIVCDPTCLACNGTGPSNCESCIDTHAYLQNGTCFCEEFYYYKNYVCEGCSLGCSACLNSSYCMQCSSGYFLNGTICQPCDPVCDSCSGPNSNECLSCEDTNSVLVSGSCECISGYYFNTSCSKCNPNCFNCTGPMDNQCLACNVGMILANGQCQCQTAYFFNGSYCEKCNSACSSCFGQDFNQCLNCSDPNAVLINNECVCIDGYFFDSSTNFCEACDSTCFTCTNNSLSCTSCKNNMLLFNGNCNCDFGYFIKNYSCEACGPTCGKCLSNDFNLCLECIDNSMIYNKINFECSCPTHMYFDGATCKSCETGCDSCNITNCIKASPGYYLQGSSLHQCDIQCKECFGPFSNNCLSCYSDFSLLNQTCNCSEKFYPISANKCLNCLGNCLKCTDNLTCDECITGFYFNITTMECSKCHKTCKECIGSSHTDCTECRDVSVNVQNPYGPCTCEYNEYILNKNPLICESCQYACSKCDQTQCFYCDIGFQLQNQVCVENILLITFTISQSNTISLYFSEELSTALNNSDLIIFFNSSIFDYRLFSISKSQYQIILMNVYPTASLNVITLNFIQNIQGTTNSTLNETVYNLTLNYVTNATADTVASNIKTASQAVMVVAASSAVSSIFLNNQPSIVWTALNSAQILCYIPLQNIEMPDRLVLILKSLKPILILPNLWKVFKIYDCETEGINKSFEIYEYTCKYFITNTGEVTFAFIASICMFPLIGFFYCIGSGKFKNFFGEKLKEFKWNFFLRFWIESYIDIIIPCVITYNYVIYIQLSIDNDDDKLNSTLGFTLGILSFGSFITCAIFILYKHDSITSKESPFYESYSTFYDEFHVHKGLSHLMYYPLFFIRRACYGVILYNLSNYPGLQVLLNLLHTFIVIFYVWKFLPFKITKLNYLTIAQEILIFISFGMSGFYIFEMSETNKLIIEYCMIGIVAFNILISYLYAIFDGIMGIKEKCRHRQSNSIIHIHEPRKSICIKSEKFEKDEDQGNFILNINVDDRVTKILTPVQFRTPKQSRKSSFDSMMEIEDLK